jgi:ferrochelatase
MQHKKHTVPTGVMLVNLGSPDGPDTASVRRYLREFLSDTRVVEIPKFVWFFILNFIVLLVRPKKSAAAYQKVWMKEGSPLIVYSRRQAEALQSALNAHVDGEVVVRSAMRYGNPSIKSVLDEFDNMGIEHILVVPMYPQYSATTTATVNDEINRLIAKKRNQPALRFVKSYQDYDPYIQAMATRVRGYWNEHGKGDKLMMSFHGLPQRCVNKGDPYFDHCGETARLLADALLLSNEEWVMTFQSRFGAEEWLKPYTSEVLEDLGEDGLDRLDVFCPGFPADCLETLEEIAMEGKEEFVEEGGGSFHYIPALNDSPEHIGALLQLVEDNLGGWVSFVEDTNSSPIGRLISKVVKSAAK